MEYSRPELLGLTNEMLVLEFQFPRLTSQLTSTASRD
jgi:hypothetical protein